MRDADTINRTVIHRLGLDATQFKNAYMQGKLPWIEGQTAGRPWRLNEQDLVCLGLWIALTQRTTLSRAQATSVVAAVRTGLRHEPEVERWFISYDHAAGQWRVATTPPVEIAVIAVDLGVIRDRIAELRAQAQAEMQE